MIYHNLPFDKYLEIEALSSTAFKDFITSPVLYKWNRDNPRESTKSQDFGTLVHSKILEPDLFETDYIPLHKDVIKEINKFRENKPDIKKLMPVPKQRKGTAAWKKLVSDNEGYELIFKEDYDKIVELYRISEGVGKTEMVDEDIYNEVAKLDARIEGNNEFSVVFEYKGVKCKARFDSVVDEEIWDVKTSANPYKFEREIVNWKYYIQVAVYWVAYRETFGKDPKGFNFFVVPNSQPYNDYQIVKMHPEYIEFGLAIFDRYIEDFKKCLESGDYSREVPVSEAYLPNYIK